MNAEVKTETHRYRTTGKIKKHGSSGGIFLPKGFVASRGMHGCAVTVKTPAGTFLGTAGEYANTTFSIIYLKRVDFDAIPEKMKYKDMPITVIYQENIVEE